MARAESVRGSNYPRTLQGRKIEEQLPPELAGITEDYLYDPIERECVREFKIDNDCNPILYKYNNERLDCTKYCLKNCNPKEIQLLFDNIPDQIEINTLYGGKLSRIVKQFDFMIIVPSVGNEFTFHVDSVGMKHFTLDYDWKGDVEHIKVANSKKVSQFLCRFLQHHAGNPSVTVTLFIDELPVDSKGKRNVSTNTLVFKKKGRELGFVRPSREWEIKDWDDKKNIIEITFILGS